MRFRRQNQRRKSPSFLLPLLGHLQCSSVAVCFHDGGFSVLTHLHSSGALNSTAFPLPLSHLRVIIPPSHMVPGHSTFSECFSAHTKASPKALSISLSLALHGNVPSVWAFWLPYARSSQPGMCVQPEVVSEPHTGVPFFRIKFVGMCFRGSQLRSDLCTRFNLHLIQDMRSQRNRDLFPESSIHILM